MIKTAFSPFNSNATRENILLLRSHKNLISETVESALGVAVPKTYKIFF